MRRFNYFTNKLCVVLIALVIISVNTYAVNSPWNAIEITGPVGKNLNSSALATIATKNHVPTSSIYQWNNHLVVYGKLANVAGLQQKIKAGYPQCEIKIYQKPFYDFDRKERCGSKGLAKEWDNIILTANMVNDPKMQQEYLNYHATQFQKWPEVSNGFCNADFQQLLVFKSGRQLLLIISIPKGADLDKLNPLTTKNNPRVNDWNNIMKKYQEGIPGTKPGETWVFLKPVTK